MTALLAFLQTPTGQIVLLGLGYGIREALAWWIKQKHTVALNTIAEAAADVVQSGLAAKDPQAAVAAAKAALLRDSPEVFDSIRASTVEALSAGHIALANAPGGSTVTLPTLGGTA